MCAPTMRAPPEAERASATACSARRVLSRLAVQVLGRKEVTPREAKNSAIASRPATSPSIVSCPTAPWTWTSMKPGINVRPRRSTTVRPARCASSGTPAPRAAMVPPEVASQPGPAIGCGVPTSRALTNSRSEVIDGAPLLLGRSWTAPAIGEDEFGDEGVAVPPEQRPDELHRPAGRVVRQALEEERGGVHRPPEQPPLLALQDGGLDALGAAGGREPRGGQQSVHAGALEV